METKVNKINESTTEIEFIFSAEEIASDLAKEVQKETKKIKIDGFRAGKVPQSVIKKFYGDSLEHIASEAVAKNKFFDYAEEKELQILGTPSIVDLDFKPGEKLTFKVKYEHPSEIELKQYKGLTIEVPELSVTEDEVEAEFRATLKPHMIVTPAEVVEDNNCYVKVELTPAKEDGTVEEGQKPSPFTIDLTDETVNPELRSALLQKNKGDEFEFRFEDKHSYKKEDGTEEEHTHKYFYKGVIKEIEKVSQPELNEELCMKISNGTAKTETELRDGIRKQIQDYYDYKTQEFTDRAIEDKIIEANPYTPAPSFVKRYLNLMVEEQLKNQKKSNKRKYTREQLEKGLQSTAETTVKWYQLSEKIKEVENITLTPERITELAAEHAEKFKSDVATISQLYANPEVQKDLLRKEVYEFLKKNNTIVYVKKEERKD